MAQIMSNLVIRVDVLPRFSLVGWLVLKYPKFGPKSLIFLNAYKSVLQNLTTPFSKRRLLGAGQSV